MTHLECIHRKGYTRAPFDDWRRGGEAGNEAGQPGEAADGWRTSGNRRWGGAGAGLASGQVIIPYPVTIQCNNTVSGQGWRTERENYNRVKYGESAPRPQVSCH